LGPANAAMNTGIWFPYNCYLIVRVFECRFGHGRRRMIRVVRYEEVENQNSKIEIQKSKFGSSSTGRQGSVVGIGF